MTSEGFVCKCCGFESWDLFGEDSFFCDYKDEFGEHDWLMVLWR